MFGRSDHAVFLIIVYFLWFMYESSVRSNCRQSKKVEAKKKTSENLPSPRPTALLPLSPILFAHLWFPRLLPRTSPFVSLSSLSLWPDPPVSPVLVYFLA